MIADVAKVEAHLRVDARHVVVFEAAGNLLHGTQDSPEPHQLAPEIEDPGDLLAVEEGIERMALHDEHFLLDRLDDRKIAVDDEIEHRVQDIIHAMPELSGRGLQLPAQLAVGARRAMPHGNQMVGADEHIGLAVADLFALQMGGAGDHEELVAIDVDFGDLARGECILDSQGMKIEAVLQDTKLFRVRLVQADPGKLARRQLQALGRMEIDLPQPPSVGIDIGGNDAHSTTDRWVPKPGCEA